MISGVTMKINMDEYILHALKEDITSEDVSTNAVMPDKKQGTAQLICKADGIICGLEVFERTFTLLDETFRFDTDVKDGDRVFGPGPRDSCQHLFSIRIVPEDIELIRQFDVCHTSCYSNIEYELPALSEACKVSFDFSDKRDEAYLRRVCPYVTYAFFSGADLSEEAVKALMEQAHGYGASIVGVTRGKEGAIFYDGKAVYRQGIVKVDAIDTMGAGDSFIAGFLTRYTDTGDMEASLRYAAERSAKTCTERGGFGHPHPLR